MPAVDSRSDSSNKRVPKPPQKPVFIIPPEFDVSNQEHLKGNIQVTMNRKFATDLCNLIRDCDIEKEEGHILAFKAHIENWYNLRFVLMQQKREAEKKAQKEEALASSEAETSLPVVSEAV